jgi:hypothetical protein
MWSDLVMTMSARDLVRFATGDASLAEIWLLRAEQICVNPLPQYKLFQEHPEFLVETLRAYAKRGIATPHLLQELSERDLRKLVEQELRWLAGRWRDVLGLAGRWRDPLLPSPRKQRGAAEPARSGARQRAWENDWLRNADRSKRLMRWEAPGLQPCQSFPDALGVLHSIPVGTASPEAFIAIILTSLLSAKSASLVGECALEGCRRLFVQPLVGDHSKRTRLCCSDAHDNTLRSKRKRKKDEDKPRKRKLKQ